RTLWPSARSLAAAARLLIGIANAGTDMRLHSAAPATIPMARAFMGHSLSIGSARPVTSPPTLNWHEWYRGRRPPDVRYPTQKPSRNISRWPHGLGRGQPKILAHPRAWVQAFGSIGRSSRAPHSDQEPS